MQTVNKPPHLLAGQQAETLAIHYLLSLGYEIRGRNVRCHRDEIDIIAFDPQHAMIVFVEVKSRRRSSSAYPVRSAVNAHKRRCLSRAINWWVAQNQYDGPARLDIVCVVDGKFEEHLVDAGSEYM